MPALYDEVWAARIQWERTWLALESLGIIAAPPEPGQPEPESGQPEPEPAPAPLKSAQAPEPEPLPLNEGAGGQLTLF